MDDNEFQIVEQMVRKNNERKQIELEKALKASIAKEKIEHKAKKREQLKTKILVAIATILLTYSLVKTIGPIIIDKFEDARTGIEIVNSNSDEIDNLIQYYETLMKTDTGERSIETITGRNFEKNEPYVDYTYDNINNLAITINEASQKSEVKTRCVIISAYKIINEPYRERILNSAFKRAIELASENPNTNYKCSYLYENGIEEFIKNLGYQDLNDYNDHERDNIKELNLLDKGAEFNGKKRI